MRPLVFFCFCLANLSGKNPMIFHRPVVCSLSLRTRSSGQIAQVPSLSQTSPEFEVVTVKPGNPNAFGWRVDFNLDGFVAQNATLRQLIQNAYDKTDERCLVGGPAWVRKDTFDIQAKFTEESAGEYGSLTLEQRRVMLQRMLADRFGLVVHHEAKSMPVYALTISADGPKLRSAKPELSQSDIKGMDTIYRRGGNGILEVENISMPALASSLSSYAGRIVVDRTGLKGRYDVKLHWTPSNAAYDAPPQSEWPSLFSALQEQLGLHLASRNDDVDVLVVDGAHSPPEN